MTKKERFDIYLYSGLFLILSVFFTLLIAILSEKSSIKEYIDPISQLIFGNIIYEPNNIPKELFNIQFSNSVYILITCFLTIFYAGFGISLNYIRIKTNSVFGAIFLHPFANICGFISLCIFKIENEFWAGHLNIISILILLPFSIYFYLEGKNFIILKNNFLLTTMNTK